MNFKKALKKLNIEDYAERIFNSNSNGELFHIYDYIDIADTFKDKDMSWFRGWFEDVVKEAEIKWNRLESVFQHIKKILIDNM